jgi:K+-sensing histidine kinase KdpD
VLTGRKSGSNWLFGTSISVAIAALLIFLARGSQRSPLVPILFIVVVVVCARYFGLMAGILGSVAATGLFACFLFQPYGSFRVHDHEALSNLALLLVAGIALSYANTGHQHDQPRTALKP